MRLAIAAIIVLLATPAYATGGLWCQIEDANITLDISAGYNREGLGNWFGVTGNGDIKLPVTPAALKSFKIEDKHLTMRWFDGKQMLLEIQYVPETGSFNDARITITTKVEDEATYSGTYTLELFSDQLPEGTDPEKLKATGKVECSAD